MSKKLNILGHVCELLFFVVAIYFLIACIKVDLKMDELANAQYEEAGEAIGGVFTQMMLAVLYVLSIIFTVIALIYGICFMVFHVVSFRKGFRGKTFPVLFALFSAIAIIYFIVTFISTMQVLILLAAAIPVPSIVYSGMYLKEKKMAEIAYSEQKQDSID